MTNSNLHILPWYSSKDLQNRFAPQYVKSNFKLWSPTTALLPFQFELPQNFESIQNITLISADESTYIALTDILTYDIIELASINKKFLVYKGETLLNNVDLEQNAYYIRVSYNSDNGIVNLYSEIFNTKKDLSSFIKLEYWDSTDFISNDTVLIYNNGFKHAIYLETEVGMPEYPFEEVANDRDGYKYIESQISRKTYNIEFDAPEFICDALRILRMHDYITILDTRNRLYHILDALVTPEWVLGGSLANIKIAFDCDTNLKSLTSRFTEKSLFGLLLANAEKAMSTGVDYMSYDSVSGKRIFELNTYSDEDLLQSYLVLDKTTLSEARKINIGYFATNTDLTRTNERVEALEEESGKLDKMFIDEGSRIKALKGLYTESFISAQGVLLTANEGGGGGISLTDVWNSLSENNSLNQIHVSHLSTALSPYATTESVAKTIVNVEIEEETGIFTFTRKDNTTFEIDSLLEKVVTNFYYDNASSSLVLVLEDGTEQRVSLSAFIKVYTGYYTDTISVSVSASNVITANVRNGSIDKTKLELSLQTDLERFSLDIKTLQGYFTDGKAKSAMDSDKLGGLTADKFAKIEVTTWLDANFNRTETAYIFAKKGICTESFISAQGVLLTANEGSGGGISLTDVWNSLAENNSLNQIHLSHLSVVKNIKVNESTLADSANKLSSSKTLWGRPFDGSANVTGDLIDVGNITMDGIVNIKMPSSTAANGLFFKNTANTTLGSIGALTTSSGAFNYNYIGWGTQAYSLVNNLAVSQFVFKYKNNNVLYEGFKLTKALEWVAVSGHSGYVGQVGLNFLISIDGSTSNDGLLLNSTTEKIFWRGSELLTINNIADVDINSSNIIWGGDNISNGFSALDAALSPTLSANRLQGTATSAISVEYTSDGGLNWIDYEATDKQKKDLFVAGQSADFRLGKRTESGDTISADDKLRITIDANLAPIYNQFEKFILYLSIEGAQGTAVTIQGSTAQSPNTWITLTDKQFVNGWSGYNVINQRVLLDNNATTTPSGRYRYLRFVFEQETSESTYRGMVVRNMQGFGGVGWVTPSNEAAGSYPYKITNSVTFGITRAAFDMGVGADFYVPKTNGKLILNSLSDGHLSTNYAALQLYQTYLGKASGSRTSVDIGSTSDRFTNYYASGLFNTSSSVFNSITTNGGINTESREFGLITAYDVNKITAIWNLSEPYKIDKDGSGFGTFYGLAYYHPNNGKGEYAGGHQVMFVVDAIPRVALGNNLWTSGKLISAGAIINGVSDIFTTNIWNTVGDRTAASANRLILSSGAQIANIYHINAAGNQARDLKLGSTSITNKALFYKGYGFKWGIGTEDPTEELDVVGTIRGREGIYSEAYIAAQGVLLTSEQQLIADLTTRVQQLETALGIN